jgi:hypothetical protein
MKFVSTLAFVAWTALSSCASAPLATFATPEEAVQKLIAAADDQDAADHLLGAGGFSLLRSGDDVADHQDLEAVAALAREQIAFEDVDQDRKIALLGKDRWELPIPIVREDGGWRFDVEAGREEILNRRVGRNELSTIATLRAIVDAQREYAAEGHDGKTPAFAGRLLSSDGLHDGLFWPTAENEPESPLGPLVADASEEGYGQSDEKPNPYHGYYYRLLTAQGAAAPGGAHSYVGKDGRLTGGFAVVAWPATYDNSGVVTFVVNQQGIVFQQDLGADTASKAQKIKAYDPDTNWSPTVD